MNITQRHEKTVKALKGSIRKWQAIVDGTGCDRGRKNCPLCKLFNREDSGVDCDGCPVSNHTGRLYCYDTPYEAWDEYQRDFNSEASDFETFDPDSMKMAKDELGFLKEVLKEFDANEKA